MPQEIGSDLRQVADDIVGPDVWQAADDTLQGKTDFQSAGKEAAGMWSDVKQAVSGIRNGAGETTTTGEGGVSAQQEEASSGLGWAGLKRDIERAATGLFADVRESHSAHETRG